ncbi:MAG: redoxin domain-containing protein [Pseudonocardiaceae bacterium]
MAQDPSISPIDLPVPRDDGAADHLLGAAVPALELPSTAGGPWRVDRPAAGASRVVLYAYSRIGEPGAEPPRADWDQIPGARGCTPQACNFRDHAAELAELGAAVAGVSTQHTDYQAEVAARLLLSFPLLSDARLQLATAFAATHLRGCRADPPVPAHPDRAGRADRARLVSGLPAKPARRAGARLAARGGVTGVVARVGCCARRTGGA